jgi:Cu/Ag efflux pump CusA
MFLGITKLRDAPVDVLPEFGPPTVEIQAEALGLSAVEVEQLVTVPFEQDLLNGVAFLDEIRSESLPGLSRIQLVFEPGTDLYRARQVVNERVAEAQVALPGVSKPPQMLPPRSSTNRVMMIGLSSSAVSLVEMSVLARWVINPRLLAVPGVASVEIWGFRDRQLQVLVDPEQMRDDGVSLAQVIETTGNALWASPLSFVEASVPGTGGFIDTANQRLGVMHVSPIATPEDLAQVRVEDTAYRLGDVAEVVEDHQPLIGDAAGGSGLLLVVEKFPEANTLAVTRGVEDGIDALRPGLSGIEFNTAVFRPASYIERSIDNLRLALIIAAVLVAVALGAFLFDWRAVVTCAFAIPVSLVVAGLVLYALGETINALVVAGLVAALGLVVYDAVGDVENSARRLRERRDERTGGSAADTILEAALELRGPAGYATLIVALAVAPVFVLEGVAGEFFPKLAVSYLVAVLASMAVALTLTPALTLLLASRAPAEGREGPLARWLQRAYEAVLSSALRRPGRVYVAIGAVAMAGLAALPFLEPRLSPSFKESDLLIRLDAAPGTSLPEMNRISTQVSGELRSIPGIRSVGAHVGRAVASDRVVNVNSAELWVGIDPAADYDATVASVEEVVEGYPGFSGDVLTFSNERVREVLTGTDEDFVVRVYGEDLQVLRRKAEEVERMVSGVDGVVDERVDLEAEEPAVEVEPDLAAAQRAGIRPGDIRRSAAALLSGIEVGSLFEEQKVFGVVVWGVPGIRRSLTDVRELLIDTPDGGHARLGDVASVRVAPSPSMIRHESVSRYVDVAADVEGRSVGSVSGEVERRLREIDFPLEYHAEVLGPVGRTPQDRLIAVGLAAAIGVFLLLQACFGSWRLASLTFVAFPFALAGGALGALAAGGTLSLGSLIGFVGVLGIFARNVILMIGRFQHLERDEGETFGPELVRRGARESLTPIVATALATALALLPLLALGERPGFELAHPLAAVVLGGLVTSTLLSLLVVPSLYLRVGSGPSTTPMRRLREKAAAARRAASKT